MNYECENLIEIFYKICIEIRTDLFLQMVAFFQVISYDDLILNIPYIKTIENFNSYPEFKFPTKEEI